MKPTFINFWRWQPDNQPVQQPAFASITDNDIASQVIRQIPDDQH
ncbi:hypothetical protein LY04_00388 [Oceanimonas baumannii]|uniref:Uncharacterized protein n=1 Tax=Oceanimonas baumannii TaxID=129578 RepID=A0ABY2F308_9GAMM|nr:hypothetical protein [Oceanimonas baumannii]TDW62326.1 hypothetical protein LY04_00388 [Oceanimonas baumannii]